MKRESGWYWVRQTEWWAVMLWDSEDEEWLASGSEYPSYYDYDMQEINENQIVMNSHNWVTELERQRNVLQKLLSQYAGKAINNADVQEALSFSLDDSVKPETKENPSPFFKGLRWKERESGDTELMLKSELLAVVSYEERGWYWYSMCSEVKLNTLWTNTVFEGMESAQADCMSVISNALRAIRGR